MFSIEETGFQTFEDHLAVKAFDAAMKTLSLLKDEARFHYP